MAIAFDGTKVPDYLEKMACGGIPVFDTGSGCAYRCNSCGAVIGSIAQPEQCKTINQEAEDKKTAWKLLADEI